MAAARVLVVDDEPGVLGYVSRVLSNQGYHVQAASGPLQALELARATPCFDLLVSDVIMPDMCGPELVKQIAGICPAVAVVVMSANTGFAELPKHVKFISKPFLPKDLCSVVEQALTPPLR